MTSNNVSTGNVVKTGFVANEPVIVGHFILWLFVNLGAFVVGHTHLFTTAQWDSLTTGLVPFVTAIVLGIIGTFLRTKVTPAWKSFEQKMGINNDQLLEILNTWYQSVQTNNANNPPSTPPLPPISSLEDVPLPSISPMDNAPPLVETRN